MECSICTKTIKESTKTITCKDCNFCSCITCCQTYLLSSKQESHCMNCKSTWDESFLRKHMPPSWMEGKYKAQQKERIRILEKDLLHESIPFVPSYKLYLEANQTYNAFLTGETGANATIEEAKRTLDIYQKEYKKRSSNRKEIQAKMDVLRNQIQQLKYESNHHRLNMIHAYQHFAMLEEEVTSSTKYTYTIPCHKPDCRGLLSNSSGKMSGEATSLLDKDWKCGCCSTIICKDCRCEKQQEHICDPATIASVNSILSQSKPCPKCYTSIVRSSGCDHMWCTLCNTGFSYKTGMQIENRNNTNPYYYQWKQTHTTCFSGALACIEQSSPPYTPFLTSLYQILETLSDVEQTHTSYLLVNRMVRIKYLAKEISEKELMTQGYRNIKRWKYEKEYQQLTTTLSNQLLQWFENYQHNLSFYDSLMNLPKQYITKFNTQSKILASKYQYKVYELFIDTHAIDKDTCKESRPDWENAFTTVYERTTMRV